jgi:very-short-patch-repair endonuclease
MSPNFYSRKACLVVECDGAAHDPNEQWQHDQVRDAYMLSQGLRVLRFSNDQILDDPENVLREIAKYPVPSDQEPSS